MPPSRRCAWAVRRGRESINMVSVVGGVVTSRHAWPRPADPDKCLISTQTTVNREPICAVVELYRGALLLLAAEKRTIAVDEEVRVLQNNVCE